ncbi:MAG: cardiolipin synthase [Gammaproteobacteria bacterium]
MARSLRKLARSGKAALAAAEQQAAQGPPIHVLAADGPLEPAQGRTLIGDLAASLPDPARFERQLLREQAVTRQPLVAGNDVALLVDGPATYAAMLAAIASAEEHVHLETYILADDDVGRKLSDALIAKCRAGIDVRLVYDAVGAIESSDAYFERLQEGGVACIKFHPVDPTEDARIWRINERDHRKILVIDGRVGFTGGINFSSTYASSSRSRPGAKDGLLTGWRDTHVRVEGPVVSQLQRLFLDVWHDHCDDAQSQAGESSFYPRPAAAGDTLVRMIASNGSDGLRSAIFAAYLNAFAHAQRYIWLTQAYFAPDDHLLDALRGAAARGVDVRVVVPGFTDSTLIFNASRARYGRLLRAGVRVYEMPGALLHAKTAVIDGVWSTVGSSNLDSRSARHNLEANAVILGRSFGRRMESLFEEDRANAVEITRKAWRRRGSVERMKERFATLFDYWL